MKTKKKGTFLLSATEYLLFAEDQGSEWVVGEGYRDNDKGAVYKIGQAWDTWAKKKKEISP